MALVIVTGGSTGATDGTAVSSSNKLTFAAIDTPIDAHVRCESSQETDDLSFTLPSDVSISFDGGSTWHTGAHVYGNSQASLGPKNVAVKFKRTGYGAAETFTTTGIFGSGTAPSLSGTLTATGGDTKVTLSGPTASDAVGIDHYVIEYGTTTGYGSTQTVSSTNTTFPSTDVTGLTNGTTYYFRLKAYDAAGNASSGLTASASTATIPTTLTISTAGSVSDNFNRADGSLGSNWTSDVGSTVRINGNKIDCSNTSENRIHYNGWSKVDQLAQFKGTIANSDVQVIGRLQSNGYHYLMIGGTRSTSNPWYIFKYTGSYSQVATTSISGGNANDVIAISVTGTNPVVIKGYRNGTQMISYSDSSSPLTSAGYAGWRSDVGTASASDDFLACSNGNITITNVPAGWSGRISDGSNTVTANVSSGTITLTPSTLGLLGGGWTLTIYDAADAGGTQKFSQSGVYGGDSWALS